jgi:hypothetical protein
MNEFIRAVNGVHPGRYLQASKKSYGMREWLNTDGGSCDVMKGATHPIEEWLDVHLLLAQMESAIDRWFALRGITPTKSIRGGRENPFDIWWEFPLQGERTTRQECF